MKFILNMQQLHELFHLTILEMLPKDSLSFPLNYVFAAQMQKSVAEHHEG